jgi:hypothetical protein
MAQAPGQDFDTMLQGFLVDLNGDGVPDARVRVAENSEDASRAAHYDAISRARNERIIRDVGDLQRNYPGMMEEARQKALERLGRKPAAADVNPTLHPTSPPASSASRGGVLDTLSLPPQTEPQPRNALSSVMGVLNGAAGIADHYLIGAPSSLAGLVNAAIPGQPLGGLDEAKRAAAEAKTTAASNPLGRDLLALPEAFSGSVPSGISLLSAPNALAPQGRARGLMEGTPNVYQRPFEYFPNEIKSPQPPVPAGSAPYPTPRARDVDYFTPIYQMPGDPGRGLIDRIGKNRINQPIFTDTNKYAPYDLAEIKARVAAGDAAAAERWQQLKEAAAKKWGLDLETMKPLQQTPARELPPKPRENR